MAILIPESLKRLQTTAFVENTELEAFGRVDIIRHAARELAESALRKLLDDCITTEGGYMGHPGSTLRLDVYVLSQTELHQLVAQAVNEGRRGAMRFMPPNA